MTAVDFAPKLREWFELNQQRRIVAHIAGAVTPRALLARRPASIAQNLPLAAAEQQIPLLHIGLVNPEDGFIPPNLSQFGCVSVPLGQGTQEFGLYGGWVGEGEKVNPIILIGVAGGNAASTLIYPQSSKDCLLRASILGQGSITALSQLSLLSQISHFYLEGTEGILSTFAYLQKTEKGFHGELTPDILHKVMSLFSFTPYNLPAFHALLKDFTRWDIIAQISKGIMQDALIQHGKDSDHYNFKSLVQKLFGSSIPPEELNSLYYPTAINPAFAQLFGHYCPGWEKHPGKLNLLPSFQDHKFREDVYNAHRASKITLLELLERHDLSPDVLTVGFEAGSSSLDWGTMLRDEQARKSLLEAAQERPIQIVFSYNKALGIYAQEYRDEIKAVIAAGQVLEENSAGKIRFIVVPQKEVDGYLSIISGVDVWLNGTIEKDEPISLPGMVAQANGVPCLFIEKGESPSAQGLVDRLFNTAKPLSNMDDQIDMMIKLMSDINNHPDSREVIRELHNTCWHPRHTASRRSKVDPLTLCETVAGIASAGDINSAEEIYVKSLREIFGASEVRRYEHNNNHLRIYGLWELCGGKLVKVPAHAITSHFKEWTPSSKFETEAMADLLNSPALQFVADPEHDPRCKTASKDPVVIAPPFILVPLIIEGEVKRIYKIDLAPGAAYPNRDDKKIIRGLTNALAQPTINDLQKKRISSLARFVNQAKTLIIQFLVRLTGGGFPAMRDIAAMSNRTVLFMLNKDGNLVPSQAIGVTTTEEFWTTFEAIAPDLTLEVVEDRLCEKPPIDGPLDMALQYATGEGYNLGSFFPSIPIEIRHGALATKVPADFDLQRFNQLRQRTETLFRLEDKKGIKTIDNYLLLPVIVKGQILGMVYIDNAFTGNPLYLPKHMAITKIFSEIFNP